MSYMFYYNNGEHFQHCTILSHFRNRVLGHSHDFSKEGGGEGVTLCQSEGTHQIVMSFSPAVGGCLFKKGLQRGEGVTGTQGPPSYAPVVVHSDLFPVQFWSL